MGDQPLIFFAPVGALFLALLVLIIAAEQKRVYPIVALGASLVCAGYLALKGPDTYVSWFFIAFAVVSPPISLLVYAARWIVARRGRATSS
jgi:hypothetical protein